MSSRDLGANGAGVSINSGPSISQPTEADGWLQMSDYVSGLFFSDGPGGKTKILQFMSPIWLSVVKFAGAFFYPKVARQQPWEWGRKTLFFKMV